MIYPKKLLPGDTVGLIAPCSPISEGEKEACVKAVSDMGFKLKIAPNLTENFAGYMAGSGKVRGDSINEMFADPDVDAIFCVRGGNGSTRAYPYIDLDVVRQNPKVFLGFSDVTTHHLLFNQSCDLITFHGPMPINMIGGLNEFSRKSLFDCINGDGTYEYKNPDDMPIGVLKEGKAEGRVIGGNLSLLSAAVGTPYDPDTRGKILFIEEVSEPITKIEKWLCHLLNAGKLRESAGILLGQFTDMGYRTKPPYTELDIVREILEDAKVPVMYNLQSGHGGPKVTIPMGAVCRMDTASGKITFDIER